MHDLHVTFGLLACLPERPPRPHVTIIASRVPLFGLGTVCAFGSPQAVSYFVTKK